MYLLRESLHSKGTMWNCAERHLRRRKTEVVPCPVPECKSKCIVLENDMWFKNHAKVVHGRDLRPKITIYTKMAANLPESLNLRQRLISHEGWKGLHLA